ncbi:hypothetical protein FHS37_005281 [Streptomyces griseostramineus]|uniref:Mutator family transposase n=1 Tax=Streptomyces griseomycini TaxID=66895 RepID=A0A7W7PTU4_9ACTN|nr:hypothetical protein [Streptomyces griseomycini]
MAGENVTGVESVEQSGPQPAGAVDDRLTDVGLLEIVVSRGRGGSFEPKTVRKRHKRLTGVDEMVIPSAAKGLTTGEVQAHLAEVRGAEVSRRTVCTITDEVLGGMAGWLQPAARRRLSGGLRRRRPREDPGSVDDLVIRTVERGVPTVRDHASGALVMCSWSCFRICPRC